MSKINSLSKRYRRPKTFDAELFCVAGRGPCASFGLTLCDPRTKSGEGYRFYLEIAPEDVNQPIMASFIAQLYAMLSPEMREQFSLCLERYGSRTTK